MKALGASGPPVDRYTVGHAMLGYLLGLWGAPWWIALGVSVGFEAIENPLKRRVPGLFPEGSQDTLADSSADVAAWMAGYGLAKVLYRDKVPAIWR